MKNNDFENANGIEDAFKSSQVQASKTEKKKSFSEAAKELGKKIDLASFPPQKRGAAAELVMIAAEVKVLPASAAVRIAGNDLPAEIVSEVFEKIEKEHIELTLENFSKIRYEVKSIKTYLRTALYNSVFEIEARSENEYRSDFDFREGIK